MQELDSDEDYDIDYEEELSPDPGAHKYDCQTVLMLCCFTISP